MDGLVNIVDHFASEHKPAFSDGSHCKIAFPFEAWGKEQHYTMPDIVMSLPGNSESNWAGSWEGISTVFEVKRGNAEDPVNEATATINTDRLPTAALIQISKNARNLLHTHRLLYAYVVGIYNCKARIYRFDHAAGVVSKAIDLKEDPFPLFDFIWRFCHYEQPALKPPHAPTSLSARTQTRSMAKTGRGSLSFLGMDPTITTALEQDYEKINELLKNATPPKAPFAKEETKACRWVAVVTEYHPDGSAKTTKWYLMYRLRFLNTRLFSRATAVWDAYEVENGEWQPRAIKDAWRQLARDREDVLYARLRDGLRTCDDLEKLVEECKNFGLPPRDDSALDTSGDDAHSDAPPPSTAAGNESEYGLEDEGRSAIAEEFEVLGDTLLYGLPDVETGDCDLGAREARKLWDRTRGRASGSQNTGTSAPSDTDLDSLAQGGGRPPVYDVYHRTICAWLREETGKDARFNERSHMRLVMKTVGRPLSSFKSTKEMVTAIRDAIIGL